MASCLLQQAALEIFCGWPNGSGTRNADNASADLRGTACGMFNLGSGLMLLLARLLSGLLRDRLGSSATFVAGALFSLAALAVIPVLPASLAWGSGRGQGLLPGPDAL